MRKGAEKLSRGVAAKQQGRLDTFFTSQPKKSPKKEDDRGKTKGKGKAEAKGTKRKASFCCLYPRVIPTHRATGR